MKFNNDTENHEFLHYIIENRPTSQCHVVGSSHVITFDEKKFQLLFQNSAWFILDQTLNHHEFFRIFVKFQFCGGEFVCPCALFGMENSQWIYLNHCHQFSVMVEHSEKILLSSARSNMTFFVSIWPNIPALNGFVFHLNSMKISKVVVIYLCVLKLHQVSLVEYLSYLKWLP